MKVNLIKLVRYVHSSVEVFDVLVDAGLGEVDHAALSIHQGCEAGPVSLLVIPAGWQPGVVRHFLIKVDDDWFVVTSPELGADLSHRGLLKVVGCKGEVWGATGSPGSGIVGGFIILGIVLIADSIGWFLGYPLLPVN